MPAKKRYSRKMPTPPYPGTRDKGKESLVKVAAIQFEPHIGNKAHSVHEGLKLIERAGKKGAQLMVLACQATSEATQLQDTRLITLLALS